MYFLRYIGKLVSIAILVTGGIGLGACGGDDEGDGGGAGDGGGNKQAVETCIGNCPAGECDDELFFTDVECSQSVDVGSDGDVCPSADLGYCLSLEDGTSYAVDCQAENQVTPCENGCGVDEDGVECLN